MPEPTRLVVRDTPVDLLRAGSGPPLLFLHGAGSGRALAQLPGAAGRALRRAGADPSRPRRLAGRRVDRAHLRPGVPLPRPARHARPAARALVGASFGGWIAAEMATMASHRLASLVLIDPVGHQGRGLDLSVPVRHGAAGARGRHDLPQSDGGAGAGAAGHERRHARAMLYRQSTALARVAWNPYLYDPLLRRRLARITTPTLLAGAPTTGWRRSSARRRGARRSRAPHSACSTTPATCRTSRSRTRWRRRSSSSARAGRATR